jgi:hypothetical protein
MRLHVALCASLILAGTTGADTVTAQELRWAHAHGGDLDDFAYDVAAAPDSGFYLCGGTASYGAGSTDFYVLRTDSAGDTLWTRSYGGQAYDLAWAVLATADGGCLVAGQTASSGAGGDDVYLVRVDAAGATLWTRTYGGTGNDAANAMVAVDAGGFVIAGSTASFGNGQEDYYLLRVDSAGDTLWTRTYGGADRDFAYSLVETADEGFIVGGASLSYGAGNWDAYLVRTDADGIVDWTRTYGGYSSDGCHGLLACSGGGFFFTGSTHSFGAGNFDVYLVRALADGTPAWTRTYGGPGIDSGNACQPTADGGFIIAGDTSSFGVGESDVYVLRIEADGDTLWTCSYGRGASNNGDWSMAIRPTLDHHLVIAGQSETFGNGRMDVWLLKIDDATLPTGIEGEESGAGRVTSPDPVAPVVLLGPGSPNPFAIATTIPYRVQVPGVSVRLRIYDLHGRLVRTLYEGSASTGRHTLSWDGRDDRHQRVAAGVYLADLETVAGRQTAKLVLTR